ncbi:MAG: hypothetical protein HKN41_01005, partial [Ilumatobacter sp.]|nr:hypothetical protein [Ilumatobacter sp.]
MTDRSGDLAPGDGHELHRAAAARLADLDQQYTANRRAVVEDLATAGGPITLPDLLAGSG